MLDALQAGNLGLLRNELECSREACPPASDATSLQFERLELLDAIALRMRGELARLQGQPAASLDRIETHLFLLRHLAETGRPAAIPAHSRTTR